MRDRPASGVTGDVVHMTHAGLACLESVSSRAHEGRRHMNGTNERDASRDAGPASRDAGPASGEPGHASRDAARDGDGSAPRSGSAASASRPALAKRSPLRAIYDKMFRGARSPERQASRVTGAAAAAPRGSATNSSDRYTILRKVGEGGMGVVFAARDEQLGRTVALKRLTALGPDDTARKRFWREARLAASVNHPNICQLYEIGESGDTLYITMELLEGEPLSERLRKGALTVTEAVPIALQVLAALSAMHAVGIV